MTDCSKHRCGELFDGHSWAYIPCMTLLEAKLLTIIQDILTIQDTPACAPQAHCHTLQDLIAGDKARGDETCSYLLSTARLMQ